MAQVTFDGAAISSFAASFEFSCDGQPVVGAILYNADPTFQNGYYLYGGDGGLYNFGDAGYLTYLADLSLDPLDQPVVGMAITSSEAGYWFVASDGGVFAYGDAPFRGSAGDLHLDEPIVGMAASPGGHGYWLVAADGGIFNYGNAGFYGSLGNQGIDNIAGIYG